MPANKYSNLLSPISLGPIELRNRAIMSGHGLRLGDGSGGIGERLGAYIVARARGGAAMVSLSSSPVHISALDVLERVRLFTDSIVPELARTADEVHAAGSLLSVILWHGGRQVSKLAGQPLAPSPIPSGRTGEMPKVLRREDIKEIVAAFGSAADRCRRAGLDAVEIQTSSDYLLGSFLSPTLNRRKDIYGGSLENRARIVVEVLETVREACRGKLAVGVRTSVAHLVPTDPNDYGFEESLAAMNLLVERELVDWVSLVTGSHWSIDQLFPLMGTPRAALAKDAQRFKKKLGVPIIVAGRIRTPGEAESIIAKGQADVVAMARTWIAEPDWVNKIVRGDENRITPCTSCNQGCLGFVQRGLPGTCILNPVAGREREFARLEPAERQIRLGVIGGGPAGLETARIAAMRGHEVTLFEATAEVGGDMRLAGQAPHRGEMLDAVHWWERELDALNIDVRLNTAITPDHSLKFDKLVWAIGSRVDITSVWRLRPHLVTGIPGAEGLPHGRRVIDGTVAAKGDVLVVDEEGSWPAVSLVETLAAMPEVSSVTVVTSWRSLGEPDLVITMELREVSARLRAPNLHIHAEAYVKEIVDRTAALSSGERIGPFDTIVLSTGTAANDPPDGTMAVGDCVAPRGIWAATHDAAILARNL